MMNDEQENTKEPLKEDLAKKEPGSLLESEIGVQNFDQTISSLTLPKHLLEADDWTMKALDSNVHQEKKQDKWEMPPPIFRVSSGTKPDKSNWRTPRLEMPAHQPEASAAIEPNIQVQHLPHVPEEFAASGDVSDLIEETPAKTKSKAERILFIVVGILAVILFALTVFVGVYFLYFYNSDI
ncbi:hypothetical protein BH24ACI2_BH24ACI2_04190 [soil metagenome]|nr:DUF308 domain-containing protein [Acidobacteriota bacterium]